MFVATINVPGYLPMDDDPPTFDTVKEAWDYLATERKEGEDSAFDAGLDASEGYSATVNTLESVSTGHLDVADVGLAEDGTGSIYGDTPGYDGDHDLGLAYSVSVVEEESTDN